MENHIHKDISHKKGSIEAKMKVILRLISELMPGVCIISFTAKKWNKTVLIEVQL